MLTIGAREGSYPGMAAGHTFNVVIVAAGMEPVRSLHRLRTNQSNLPGED